jgi:hypothetical protein
MSKKFKNFWILFFLQFWTYSVSVISWRSVAQANYISSVLIDTLYGAAQFFIIKKIAKDEEDVSYWGFTGYTLGGAVGTVVGIWVSKIILGQ